MNFTVGRQGLTLNLRLTSSFSYWVLLNIMQRFSQP